jgi:hypothetical protein
LSWLIFEKLHLFNGEKRTILKSKNKTKLKKANLLKSKDAKLWAYPISNGRQAARLLKRAKAQEEENEL